MTFGVIETARLGGVPLLDMPPRKWPWWWTKILLLERRFANLRESAAYDQDKMAPPKDFWLDDEKLEAWFEERKLLREQGA